MKPFVRPKMNGAVTIRRFHPPQLETTAKISKGELVEPLPDIALRVGLAPSKTEDILLVDAQELALMGKLCDKAVYYLTGGTIVATAAETVSHATTTPEQAESPGKSRRSKASGDGRSPVRLSPDAAVAWAFDARVLKHEPDNHRSPETPYRLQRAVEALRESPRASEMLPRQMLGGREGRSPSLSATSSRRGSLANEENKSCFIPPRLATREEILSFQDPAVYSAFVDQGTALKNLKSDVYCNEHTSSVAAKLSVAAVIDAGRLVLAASQSRRAAQRHAPSSGNEGEAPLLAFCLVRPPGHHCTASRPSGFCLVNNVAIAAQQLLREPCSTPAAAAGMTQGSGKDASSPRLAILDLDVHFGEGTASFVDGWGGPDAPSSFPLLYLSLHRYDKKGFYPFEAAGATGAVGVKHPGCICNVAVDTQAHVPGSCHEVISDTLLAEAVEKLFIPRLDAFRPDVVFVSLGFDAGYGDPLGKMAVEGGFAATTAALKTWCTGNATGLVVVLEGGYNPETVAQGVLSVGYALTFPSADADVQRCTRPQVPRVWGDLRMKQQRRLREWEQVRKEQGGTGGGEQPALVARTDEALMEEHVKWCQRVVADAQATHAKAAKAAAVGKV